MCHKQTRVGGGSGEMTFGAGDSGYSIALDEINNMLYVRGETYIYKLSAGDATQLPTYHNTLTDMLNGEGYFYGIAVDAKNGYGTLEGACDYAFVYVELTPQPHELGTPPGYATSSNSSPYGVLMFALGEGTGKRGGIDCYLRRINRT